MPSLTESDKLVGETVSQLRAEYKQAERKMQDRHNYVPKVYQTLKYILLVSLLYFLSRKFNNILILISNFVNGLASALKI